MSVCQPRLSAPAGTLRAGEQLCALSHRCRFNILQVARLLRLYHSSCTLLLCAFLYAAVKHQSWGLPESWPADEVVWIIDRMLVTDTTNPRYFMYPSLAVYVAYFLPALSWLFGATWTT